MDMSDQSICNYAIQEVTEPKNRAGPFKKPILVKG